MRCLSFACVAMLAACGPGGGTGDAGSDGGPVNGCTAFTAASADGGATVISGPTNANPTQYTPNCVTIKAGGSVTWTSAFGSHPLQPSGGTTPSPIALTSSGSTVSFTFPNPGTYGFECANHPAIMFGAVQVTP